MSGEHRIKRRIVRCYPPILQEDKTLSMEGILKSEPKFKLGQPGFLVE